LGTVTIGWRYGSLIAVVCVATWLGGDVAAGVPHSWRVLGWNALIALSTYLVIVWLFATVQKLQREMHERVRQRTAALTAEIAERERLEKILLEMSERERVGIGRELHDNLGQHFTGTALAGQILGEKLQALGLAEEADAWRVVALIDEGIEKTRQLARGLFLEDIDSSALAAALQEVAATVSVQYRVACEFHHEGGPPGVGNDAARHLVRIAQEAARNAVRHGKATRIVITLCGGPEGTSLRVHDHGTGLPPPPARGDGLGLRIMAHRVQLMHGDFRVEPAPSGGTVVWCRVPASEPAHGS